MAVYTPLTREDIETFIEPFGIGPLIDFEGVAEGIENTNYFLTTDQSDIGNEFQSEPLQQFVLTLFESIPARELTFYSELTSFLNLRGLPVPAPLRDRDGKVLHELHGKPALLVPRCRGSHPVQPTPAQCQQIAIALADVHQSCQLAGFDHPSIRSLDWLATLARRLEAHADDSEIKLLNEVARFQELVSGYSDLPVTVIHGDLFRDNALFVGDQLTAIIDFNSAGNGYLLLDLAVLVNDWCSREDGSLDTGLSRVITDQYQQQRPLTAGEKALWNDFLRLAAARFWISRLASQRLPADNQLRDELVPRKDPQTYHRILKQRIRHPQHL